jgi:transposase InsO family protein
VTQFHTGEGWLYLAAVLDLWSRRVIGWAIGSAVNADLVGDALVMAFHRRRPDRRVVHHSDRGAVYTSVAFSTRLTELELDQSFSAVGSCYDCGRRVVLRHPQTRTRLDPPPHDMAGQNDTAQRAVRLHRSVLQHPAHSTAPRPSKPHRLREPRRRVISPCPPSRGKTENGVHIVGVRGRSVTVIGLLSTA